MTLKPSTIAWAAATMLAGAAWAQEAPIDMTDPIVTDPVVEDAVDPLDISVPSDVIDPMDVGDVADVGDDPADPTDPVIDDMADVGDDLGDVDVPALDDLDDVAMADILIPGRGHDQGYRPDNLPAQSARATGQPAAIAVLAEKFGPENTRGPIGAMPPGLTGGVAGGFDAGGMGGGFGGGMPDHANGKGPNR